MSYQELGYSVFKSSSVLADVKEINKLLAALLGLDCEDRDFFDHVHLKLTELFKDREQYFGFLKAFTNAPVVQKISASNDLLEQIKNCGIKSPTLVTPPILHVVAKDLIVSEAKVFTPAHQDVVSTKGSVGQVVVWVPLHDVNEDNFGISAINGSHRMGVLPTDQSDFGHTVKPNSITGLTFNYLTVGQGDAVVFSQYLVHHTHKIGKFRMALSFRFNDILDSDWADRKYFVPFERTPIVKKYDDGRENPPTTSQNYFNTMK